ncbi:Acg family FMN-binding oxidoreductase [Novipirellula caenicola]|uniref:NAD(P)H nitroreductase acg n=1 Tax=Novipirellula caenicola TaxID=1536901 RepID=A0ABP9VWZ4_9BACT
MTTNTLSPPLLTARLRHAVQQATQAPSSHNTQPWLFRIRNDGVEVIADKRRACPVVDPQDRELYISCGAALYHLRLAMKADGLATLVTILPCRSDPDLVARVLVAGSHIPSLDERTLLDAAAKRRTNRFAFEPREVDPQLQVEWMNDVRSEDAWIHYFQTDQQKHAVADLVSEGDRLQASDRHFRRELAKWGHSNNSSRRDGLPGYTHGAGDLASTFESFLVRTFDWGDGKAAIDRQLAEGSPLLAVIGTRTDTMDAWIACGQALAKMLLRAASWSVDASYLNQAIEVETLRKRLMELTGNQGVPQILLRLGYGKQVRPTPRRPLDDVIVD